LTKFLYNQTHLNYKATHLLFGCLLAWSPIHISNGQQWIHALRSRSRWHAYRAGWLRVVVSKNRPWNLRCNPLRDEQINGNVLWSP